MVSFASFATGKWIYGSPKLEQYNGISAVEITGEPAPGYSSGDAMKAIEDIAARLPEGFHISGQVCLLRNDFQVLRLLHYMHFHC